MKTDHMCKLSQVWKCMNKQKCTFLCKPMCMSHYILASLFVNQPPVFSACS